MEEEHILQCEDSQEGIFSGIYAAYAWKLNREKVRLEIGREMELRLFGVCHQVETDPEKAEKVARTLRRRFGEEVFERLCQALCTTDPEKAQAVYETVVLGLSGKVSGALMDALTLEAVRKVYALSRRVGNEAHHFLGFLRFREVEGRVLYAEIAPVNDIMEWIMPHFADRFPRENFLIKDTGRQFYGVHPAGKDWFFMSQGEAEREGVFWEDSEKEKEMQELFRHFCHKIAIEARKNPGLQKQLLPLRFRDFMTEFI